MAMIIIFASARSIPRPLVPRLPRFLGKRV